VPQKLRDLTKRRFGRLVVERFHGRHNQTTFWWCQCDCRVSAPVRAHNLLAGRTKSCGCARRDWCRNLNSVRPARRTHGKSGIPVYNVWSTMLARCRNPMSTAYKNYGGRGIKVFKRWQKLESFYADLPTDTPDLGWFSRDHQDYFSHRTPQWPIRKFAHKHAGNCGSSPTTWEHFGNASGEIACWARMTEATRSPPARGRSRRGGVSHLRRFFEQAVQPTAPPTPTKPNFTRPRVVAFGLGGRRRELGAPQR
jgi:hypothetical protein